jgi:hypothetical protein
MYVGGGWSTYFIFEYKEEGFQYFGYDFTIPSLGREGGAGESEK